MYEVISLQQDSVTASYVDWARLVDGRSILGDAAHYAGGPLLCELILP